jgi:hypothetical protein
MKTEKIGNERLAIYDNGGKTFDRFTVIFANILEREKPTRSYYAIGMSEHPRHPQGFGQHCSAMAGRHLGKRILFASLPEDCKSVVMQDCSIPL